MPLVLAATNTTPTSHHTQTDTTIFVYHGQGPAIQLKKFHNDVKRQLINAYAGGAARVLDLACGRGGDIHKWVDARISHVVGVDLSPKEIDEAKRRFSELRRQSIAIGRAPTRSCGAQGVSCAAVLCRVLCRSTPAPRAPVSKHARAAAEGWRGVAARGTKLGTGKPYHCLLIRQESVKSPQDTCRWLLSQFADKTHSNCCCMHGGTYIYETYSATYTHERYGATYTTGGDIESALLGT